MRASGLYYKVYVFVAVGLIIALLEVSAYFINTDKLPLFYDKRESAGKRSYSYVEHFYFALDPLLGWSIDPGQVKEPLRVINNCIYLENLEGVSKDTLVLFISGGSTSDIVLQDYNWPAKLFEKFKEQGIKCKIYVGGVGGYGTSQETLKLLRDGLDIPDLKYHISYFGANEMKESAYTSKYEYDLYRNVTKKDRSRTYLPNLSRWIDNVLYRKSVIRVLYAESKPQPFQTLKNLKIMQSLSESHGYKFIPILQPVLGMGGIDSYEKFDLNGIMDKSFFDHNKNRYQSFYRPFLAEVSSYQGLYDFTDIFQNVEDFPFTDDCHVKEIYQHMISDKIYEMFFSAEDHI